MSAPISATTDDVVVSVLASDLRAAGFRKAGRSWRRASNEARTVVSYRGSWTNTTNEGLIFVLLDLDFASLGHDVTAKPSHPGGISLRLERLGPEPGRRLAYELHNAGDEGATEEVRSQIADDWVTYGLPLVQSATSPHAFAQHVARTSNIEVVQLAFEQVAEPLHHLDLQRQLIERGLLATRQRAKWRYLDRDPHPLELGLEPWAWLISQAAALGVVVRPEDDDAARAVLEDASAGMLSTRFHTGSDERAATVLAAHLGVDTPAFAEMAPGNERC